jgi:dTDP-4-dehydrorhamnose 3,5-epimerase-like enzyme
MFIMKNIKKISPFSIDSRGSISHLLDKDIDIVSILFITSKKGTTRANHYHKKDVHYIYLLKGKVEYTYKKLSSKNSKKNSVIVEKGYMIKTPEMTAHAVTFLEDSEFLAFSIRPRDRKNYENDTVRVKLVE